MYGVNPATDPHRHKQEVHYRLYHSPANGPVVICVQDFDYPDYDANRIMSPDAYDTEEEAEAALRELTARTMSDLELIARAIDPRNWDSFYDGFREDSWEHKQRRASLERAYAVLAALGDRLLPAYEGSLDDVVRQVRADFEQLILAHNAGDEGTAGHWVDSIIRTIVVNVAQSVLAAQEAS